MIATGIFRVVVLSAICLAAEAASAKKAEEKQPPTEYKVCVRGKVTCESSPENAKKQHILLHDYKAAVGGLIGKFAPEAKNIVNVTETDSDGAYVVCGTPKRTKQPKKFVLKLYTECNNANPKEPGCLIKYRQEIDFSPSTESYEVNFDVSSEGKDTVSGYKGSEKCSFNKLNKAFELFTGHTFSFYAKQGFKAVLTELVTAAKSVVQTTLETAGVKSNTS